MNKKRTLRERVERRFINQTQVPLLIFIILIIAIYGATLLESYNEDLSLNLVSELIGATFILLLVNLLLVRSKHKRWKLVNEKVNYLIARSVFRLRDGISSRAFSFHENFIENNEDFTPQDIHVQREAYIVRICKDAKEKLFEQLKTDFFTEENLDYSNTNYLVVE